MSWYEYSVNAESDAIYCPEDIKEVFDACVYETVKECERVLLGPIVCSRTHNVSDEYAHKHHVMHVVECMLDKVKVARHEMMCCYVRWLMHQVDRKFERYIEYEHDVLLNADDDHRFHSLQDVDPYRWTDVYREEYRRLWRMKHRTYPCCPYIATRVRIAVTECPNGVLQARADFAARFPE